VKVSTTLSKHYKTAKIANTTYQYFHKNTDVICTTTMSYYKGRKQRVQLQVYSGGKWYDTATEYFALGTNGKSVVNRATPVSPASAPGFAPPTSTAAPGPR